MDITSTSFGLLIAYLLPGLVTLFGLSYWVPQLRGLFNAFVSGGSNLGLFLLLALISIAASLQVTLVRWAVFEELICKRYKLGPQDFKDMRDEGRFNAFRGAVDEHYRYHQFWGCMAVAFPIVFIGWARESHIFSNFWSGLFVVLLFLVLEGLTVLGAAMAYINYVNRARSIMKGE
jgi:hypothetical protein